MATIAEVARHAGVGVATVSRVLNGSPAVREQTRQRVPAALDRLPPGLPPAVIQLIDRMLVKDRDQRLGSLQDAVAVLSGGALPDIPLHTPPPSVNTPPPRLQRGGPAGPMTAAMPRPADRSWIWALVAILLVGVGVALTIALT